MPQEDQCRREVRRERHIFEIAGFEHEFDVRLPGEPKERIAKEDHSVDQAVDDRRSELDVTTLRVSSQRPHRVAPLFKDMTRILRRQEVDAGEKIVMGAEEEGKLLLLRVVRDDTDQRSRTRSLATLRLIGHLVSR